METCKDCIHDEICDMPIITDGRKNASNCKKFKNKADFVEVVRCKECKFNVANMKKDPLDITDYSGADIVCSYHMSDGFHETDFCSYGAKMDGGNK